MYKHSRCADKHIASSIVCFIYTPTIALSQKLASVYGFKKYDICSTYVGSLSSVYYNRIEQLQGVVLSMKT